MVVGDMSKPVVATRWKSRWWDLVYVYLLEFARVVVGRPEAVEVCVSFGERRVSTWV